MLDPLEERQIWDALTESYSHNGTAMVCECNYVSQSSAEEAMLEENTLMSLQRVIQSHWQHQQLTQPKRSFFPKTCTAADSLPSRTGSSCSNPASNQNDFRMQTETTKAEDGGDIEITILANNMRSESWCLMLSEHRDHALSDFKQALRDGSLKLLKMLTASMTTADLLSFVLPDHRQSPLKDFVFRRTCDDQCLDDSDFLYSLFSQLTEKNTFKILLSIDENGDNLFYSIVKQRLWNFASVSMLALNERQRLKILQTRSSNSNTPLHSLFDDKLISSTHSEALNKTLEVILNSIPQSTRTGILGLADGIGESVIHKAAYHGKVDVIVKFIEDSNPEEIIELLQMRTASNQETPLMHAVENISTLESLLELVPNHKRFDILCTQTRYGNTILHLAARWLAPTKFLLQSMDSHQEKINLLLIKNRRGDTALDVAKSRSKIADYLAKAVRERQQVESVIDECLKDSKGEDDVGNDAGREGQWQNQHSNYFPALDQLLFRNLDNVRARHMKEEEIYAIFKQPSASLKSLYRKESERILSYEGGNFRSAHMTATALARVGLIYKGNYDEVMCLWCHVEFGCFKAPVDAQALHMAHSENVCSFLMNPEVENEPIFIQTANFPADSVLTVG